MWVNAEKRLPKKPGMYRVLRRGIGSRGEFEDAAELRRVEYINGINDRVVYWNWYNNRGVRITTVESWWQE